MGEKATLAIDAGNTRIKWGLHDGATWAARGAIPTPQAEALASVLKPLARPARAIASNVAGAAVLGQLQAACAGMGLALEVIRSQARQAGVRSRYCDPGQLGTDRWAALIAAHHAVGGHKLVVNAGTALTIDALDAEGQFLGGVILPGPALMRRSLDRGTAQLRETEGAFDPLPKSTPDAITTGAIHAAAGAVARMAEAMAREGAPPRRVVLSGGAAAELAPHLPLEPAIHENLVLDGLLLIARHR